MHKATQNIEIAVVYMVEGRPRSLATKPFDRAHTTSYLNLIETMGLSFQLELYHLCLFNSASA